MQPFLASIRSRSFDMNKNTIFFIMFILIGIGSFLIITGCQANSRGAKVFATNRCPECHVIDGKGGSVGPNLTYVGSRRSRAFIIQQIKDSKVNNPNTNMPSFGNLPEQDINSLADYLSGLK
jgi:cytochrome c553